jgi:amino-acid N-acetyltransferase
MTLIRLAQSGDLPAILALLRDAGLPHQAPAPGHPEHFLIAAGGGTVLGAIGLESYCHDGLLRSLVVRPESRFTGLGSQLVAAIEDHAHKTGINSLSLLTTTASDFFARNGYEVMLRGEAPAALEGTSKFSTLCPSQAVCMRRKLTH